MGDVYKGGLPGHQAGCRRVGDKWKEGKQLLTVMQPVSGQHVLQSPYSFWAEAAMGRDGVPVAGGGSL